jgi:hypothetical protein
MIRITINGIAYEAYKEKHLRPKKKVEILKEVQAESKKAINLWKKYESIGDGKKQFMISIELAKIVKKIKERVSQL